MKKVISIVLTVVFVVSMVLVLPLFGCKSADTEEAVEAEETVEAEEAAEAEEPAEAEEAASEEIVDLLYWDLSVLPPTAMEQEGDEKDWYINQALARFQEANPNIKVEWSEQQGDKASELLTSTGMAKSGPDVISMWGGSYVKSNTATLLPLNDYFSQEEMDTLIAGWDNNMVDGSYYGAPLNLSVTTIYYNKALFEQAGVNVEEYDGTYDSFVQLCEKIKSAGITPLIGGASDGWGMSWIEGTLFSSQVAEPESVIASIVEGNANFADTPELVAAFEASQNLYSKGFLNDDVATIMDAQASTNFGNKQGAMFMSGDWYLVPLQANLGEDLGVLPIPSMSADSVNFGTNYGGSASFAFVIPNYSKHIEEAVKLIKFFVSYDEQKKNFEKNGRLPNAVGDYTDVVKDEIQAKFLEVQNTSTFLDNQIPANVAAKWFGLESVMLSGQMTVQDFLKEWDLARDEALTAK